MPPEAFVFWTVLLVLSLVLLLAPLRADAFPTFPDVVGDNKASGCHDGGATGYWTVSNGSVREYVYVKDAPAFGQSTGDGLPNTAWCAGSSTPLSLTVTSSSSCASNNVNHLTAATHGCAFDIDIWIGTSSNDTVSCSGSSLPVLMFGGPGLDTMTASPYGDFVHGGVANDTSSAGDGPDLVCGSRAGEDPGNVTNGEGDDDTLWGGPEPDQVRGDDDDDLCQGAVAIDDVDGGPGADCSHAGAGDDGPINGGTEPDVLHLGKGTDSADADEGDDIVLAQDATTDTSIDGDTGTNACTIDSGLDSTSNCTNQALARCTTSALANQLLVGTIDENGAAVLNELSPANGNRGDHGNVQHPTTASTLADEVVGLAFDPTTGASCTLYALLNIGSEQHIVTIDPINQPSGGEYDTTAFCQYTGSPALVDIAIDAQGLLAGFDASARWMKLTNDGGTCQATGTRTLGRTSDWGHSPTGYHMAWDDPDGGFFLVLTEDPDPDAASGDELSAMDSYDPHLPAHDGSDPLNVWSMPMEAHILEAGLGQHPFTVTPENDVGHLFTIHGSTDGDCTTTGDYPFLKIQRRNWEVSQWDQGPLPCGDATVCCAELDNPPTALTVPHFH